MLTLAGWAAAARTAAAAALSVAYCAGFTLILPTGGAICVPRNRGHDCASCRLCCTAFACDDALQMWRQLVLDFAKQNVGEIAAVRNLGQPLSHTQAIVRPRTAHNNDARTQIAPYR